MSYTEQPPKGRYDPLYPDLRLSVSKLDRGEVLLYDRRNENAWIQGPGYTVGRGE